MAHPKLSTKHPRWRELSTVLAAKTRQRLLVLSRRGIGRRAVHEVTGIDHRTLARIKNKQTKYVRIETRDLIFSVPFDAHCDRAVISGAKTRHMIARLIERDDTGFTRSEIAKRLGRKPHTNGFANLEIGRKSMVLAKSQMRVEKLYNDAIGKVA